MAELCNLLVIGAFDCLLPSPAAAEREYRLLEDVLVFGGVGGIDRQSGEDESDDAGDVLPGFRSGELVHAGEEEAEAGGREDEGWNELARRCSGCRCPHGDARDDQKQTEHVACRAGGRDEKDESRGCPDAAEKTHACGGDTVASEEAKHRSDELERHRECQYTERHLLTFGSGDPAELEPGHSERRAGEAEEPDREGACNRPKHDPGAPRELLYRCGFCVCGAHATTSACAAPVLMRVSNHFACVSASV